MGDKVKIESKDKVLVDLHMHSIHSDGEDTVGELLKLCKNLGLKKISITDHDSVKAYFDPIIKENIFTGKIIPGVELKARFGEYSIEILGYNINIDIINKWIEGRYSDAELKRRDDTAREKFLKICDKLGLKYDIAEIDKSSNSIYMMEKRIYLNLVEYEENEKILGDRTKFFKIFFRDSLNNPKSKFYLDLSEFTPEYEEVIDIIHKSGGKAFLAHPFEYRIPDTIEYINNLRKVRELDGIECFHPSSEEDNKSDILVKYARDNNLYITGGSDYHGARRPGVQLGIGKGSIIVPFRYIDEWSNNGRERENKEHKNDKCRFETR